MFREIGGGAAAEVIDERAEIERQGAQGGEVLIPGGKTAGGNRWKRAGITEGVPFLPLGDEAADASVSIEERVDVDEPGVEERDPFEGGTPRLVGEHLGIDWLAGLQLTALFAQPVQFGPDVPGIRPDVTAEHGEFAGATKSSDDLRRPNRPEVGFMEAEQAGLGNGFGGIGEVEGDMQRGGVPGLQPFEAHPGIEAVGAQMAALEVAGDVRIGVGRHAREGRAGCRLVDGERRANSRVSGVEESGGWSGGRGCQFRGLPNRLRH